MTFPTRIPKFHKFKRYERYWPDVIPGDVIISPGTFFYKINDFFERDYNTPTIITQHKPMLVLARIDGYLQQDHSRKITVKKEYVSEDAEINYFDKNFATFVVYSISSGILITMHMKENIEE